MRFTKRNVVVWLKHLDVGGIAIPPGRAALFSAAVADPRGVKTAMNPLKVFDFSCLDDATFREDAVREEVVAPLIRSLGYRHRGRYRVERSKSLKHPFNMLGTRKHSVRIIPDYTLMVGKKAVLVLDAKGPGEDVSKPEHMLQAHSYASHPEIRCYHTLCAMGGAFSWSGRSPMSQRRISRSTDRQSAGNRLRGRSARRR